VEDFRARAQGLGEAVEGHWEDHELLKVHVRIRMFAAVEDIHHRHWQHVGGDASNVSESGSLVSTAAALAQATRLPESLGSQFRLVWRSVQFEQGRVDSSLICGIVVEQCRSDDVVDVVDGFKDAFTLIALGVSVPKFTASKAPVLAPLGIATRPKAPLSRTTSTSTVGLPRLSRISRADTSTIKDMTARDYGTGPLVGTKPSTGLRNGVVQVVG